MSVLGWHFLEADRLLSHGDGREVHVGEWLELDGDVDLYINGLHTSTRPIDALERYSKNSTTGGMICRVEIAGGIQRGADKMVGRRRRCLWMASADPILWDWACRVATRALEQHYPAAPEALWHALDLRLAIEAGIKVTPTARAKAESAAWVAAGDIGWEIAEDAAWAAARAAAGAIANVTAGDVASAIARATAGAEVGAVAKGVAWAACNVELTRMLHAAGAP